MKELFVVTHTQSQHHLENRVGGWYDSALSTRGEADACLVAERLHQMIGGDMVEIFTSDLRRAAMTAQAIAARLGAPLAETADLREISYGSAEGREQDWLDARYRPVPDDNRLDFDVGVDGAETRRDVAERVYRCVEMVVARDCARQIIVTHGFTLTLVIAAWMKVPVDATGFMSFPARPGSITQLRQDDFWRNRALVSLADCAHLDQA